jgi:hypothetical protein
MKLRPRDFRIAEGRDRAVNHDGVLVQAFAAAEVFDDKEVPV